MHPRDIRIADYSYTLPDEKIARYPLPERDTSKLLVYREGAIIESVFYKLHEFLPRGSLLVFNNTKVVPARLRFVTHTGATVEVFCLEPSHPITDMATAMQQTSPATWWCMVGNASKWRKGTLTISQGDFTLTAAVGSREGGSFSITFNWQPSVMSFAEMLEIAGKVPIPPYLNRESEPEDKFRYQTIFAKHKGSVAAPTAGLHFTERVFTSLHNAGCETGEITLHVGAGTFKPVKTEKMEGHDMHSEEFVIHSDFLGHLMKKSEIQDPIVAVGTTSLRVLETLYWIGIKLHSGYKLNFAQPAISQWEAYELSKSLTPAQSLEILWDYMQSRNIKELHTRTQILISPPYKPMLADALITNFHQPQSTLLLLVAALVGEEWRKIYHYALTHEFRFLSYGDSSLLYVNK
ncbi:MAG: S-adenosylmethionine:tRNA ribosyltransferase-isomerase [Chitinophagales bacterium]|nr:S-adenosylmethionine:tRNA ribosyltransferase-isomerase [Chitinophagales bacterium]MDW8419880.1 S-adenosylmethionine:tRNA ribosyltransferase-isomerase [Chitinophagales bacterium]